MKSRSKCKILLRLVLENTGCVVFRTECKFWTRKFIGSRRAGFGPPAVSKGEKYPLDRREGKMIYYAPVAPKAGRRSVFDNRVLWKTVNVCVRG